MTLFLKNIALTFTISVGVLYNPVLTLRRESFIQPMAVLPYVPITITVVYCIVSLWSYECSATVLVAGTSTNTCIGTTCNNFNKVRESKLPRIFNRRYLWAVLYYLLYVDSVKVV